MDKQAPQQVGIGRTAEVLTYGEGKVIKLFYEGVQESVVQHEFNITSLIYNAGIQSARTYEIVNNNGRLGIVYQQILPGMTLGKMITSKPWRLKTYAQVMAQLHYNLHATVPSEIPQYIQGIKQALVSKISKIDRLEDTEKAQILHHLDALPEETALCHLDFHPENVLMGEKPYIIDWTTCGVGSPLADVARTMLMLKYGSSPTAMPKFIAMLSSFIGSKLQQVYLKEYMRLSGATLADIERWVLPVATARLAEGIPDREKEILVSVIRKILKQHVV